MTLPEAPGPGQGLDPRRLREVRRRPDYSSQSGLNVGLYSLPTAYPGVATTPIEEDTDRSNGRQSPDKMNLGFTEKQVRELIDALANYCPR